MFHKLSRQLLLHHLGEEFLLLLLLNWWLGYTIWLLLPRTINSIQIMRLLILIQNITIQHLTPRSTDSSRRQTCGICGSCSGVPTIIILSKRLLKWLKAPASLNFPIIQIMVLKCIGRLINVYSNALQWLAGWEIINHLHALIWIAQVEVGCSVSHGEIGISMLLVRVIALCHVVSLEVVDQLSILQRAIAAVFSRPCIVDLINQITWILLKRWILIRVYLVLAYNKYQNINN